MIWAGERAEEAGVHSSEQTGDTLLTHHSGLLTAQFRALSDDCDLAFNGQQPGGSGRLPSEIVLPKVSVTRITEPGSF